MTELDKTLEAADEFKAWFTKTMMNADGNFDHLPDWLTEDMRRAWDAGRASTTSAGVTEEQTGTFADGVKAAARFVRQRLDDYVSEHGMYDPETGATEFPGNGDETVCEWEEIIEGLEALKEIKP